MNLAIMFSKGWKGFVAALLAQIITQIPDLMNKIPLGDWGDMTVKSAVVAILVMLANYLKHDLLIKKDTKLNTLIKRAI